MGESVACLLKEKIIKRQGAGGAIVPMVETALITLRQQAELSPLSGRSQVEKNKTPR